MLKRQLLGIMLILSTIFLVTGCSFKKEEPPRTIEFGLNYEIKNHETVILPDGAKFTITQLGNTTCDRDVDFCEWDGLRIYYSIENDEGHWDQTNINESNYRVSTGKTDFKTFATIAVSLVK